MNGVLSFMKNNQFGQIHISREQELLELQQIAFLDGTTPELNAPKAQLADLLARAFAPLTTTQSGLDHRFKQLLATPNQTLYDFFHDETPLTPDIFARLSLQLLQFEEPADFALDAPLDAYPTLNLPSFDVSEFKTDNDVVHAWYQLLTTHTKNGQNYLDYLTQTGYFVPFYEKTQAPIFFNGKAQAVFDPHTLIREVVYVEAPLDTDHDGRRDLLKAEILRPAATNAGYQAPVLYTASPYNQGINDAWGDALTHQVDFPLAKKAANQLTAADVAAVDETETLPDPRIPAGQAETASEYFAEEQNYTLNDYFLSRGFAVVYASGIGTRDSDGSRDTGGPDETTSTVAIIEWLNGQRPAFTNKTDNIEIKAWWSNRHIAMTGRSYLGTLATAAATTGVDGLKTIISEAAISSWYDYYRDGGLVAAPDTFQGEDMDVLAGEVFSRRQDAGDYLNSKAMFDATLAQLAKRQDRESGDYSAYWDGRNYLNNVKNIKADIVMVHGLNDWNVKPRNVFNLWQALKAVPVAKKLILHQGQHIYINNFRSLDFTDMMNLWLSYKLFDVDNGADTQLPDVVIQDNVTPETWHATNDWQADTDTQEILQLTADNQLSSVSSVIKAQQSFNDQLADDQFKDYTQHLSAWHHDLLDTDRSNNPLEGKRLTFKTAPLESDWVLDGAPQISVNVAVNNSVGLLSFQLVDFGSAKRFNPTPTLLAKHALSGAFDWRKDDLTEFTLASEGTPFKMISKGHINLQNQQNNYQVNDLVPNEFNQFNVTLQPTYYRIPAGHQLGLVIYATDFETTIRGNQDITYTIQLDQSQLTLTRI